MRARGTESSNQGRLPIAAGGGPAPAPARALRVCLLRPPVFQAARSLSYYGASLPLGLAYVAAAARDAGHAVTVIDALVEGRRRVQRVATEVGELAVTGLGPAEILDRVPEDTDVLGVTHLFLHEWPWLERFFAAARARRPGVLLVAGGENASAFWDVMLERCPALDACVLGEGEDTFVRLLAARSRGDRLALVPGLAVQGPDGPTRTPEAARVVALDALARPAWDLFPVRAYLDAGLGHGVDRGRSMPILTSRGCPYRCSFCSAPQMWGTRYTRRDPQEVVAEIEALVGTYGITNVEVNDLTAFLTKGWLMEFCAGLRRSGLELTFQLPSGTRSEAVDAEAARALYAAGCRNFCYAPESGSARTLEKIRKKVDLSALRRSLRASVGAGLRTHASLVIGFPHERRSDLARTAGLAAALALDGLHTLSVVTFAPYPGSEEYRALRAQGRIVLDDAFYSSALMRSAGGAGGSHHPTLTRRELLAVQLGLLSAFFAMQYALRPWRAVEAARNLATGRQETVMDQFLATKLRRRPAPSRRRAGAEAAA